MPKPQFTLYTPTDFDPKKHRSVDNYHGRDELQWQGKYRELGILIIRFELPYKIRCNGCEEYVSMGNRYDAEKRIIGKYHTMSVYKFTMHCHLCLQKWEMRTDPETLDYVCMSGCTRKEETWDPRENNGLVTTDSEVRKKLLSDKMFHKEYKDDDKRKQFHIDDENAITQAKNKIRKYDYELNGELRSKNRINRANDKEASKEEKAFQEKMGLKGSDVRILPETSEDKKAASELAKQCIAPTQKANKESIMGNLAKKLGGSRTGKTGNELFDHFKAPKVGRKIGIPEERKQIATMVKVKETTKKAKDLQKPHKMTLIPSLSSLGKLGGAKKLPGVIIKKKEEGPKLASVKRDFWEDEDFIGGFGDTPKSNKSSSSKSTSNASSVRSNLVKLKSQNSSQSSARKLCQSSSSKSPNPPASKYKVAAGVKFPNRAVKSPGKPLILVNRKKSVSSGSIVRQNSKSSSSKRKRSIDKVKESKSDDVTCLGSSKGSIVID